MGGYRGGEDGDWWGWVGFIIFFVQHTYCICKGYI